MELADVLDSKSSGSDTVPVRPRSPAPKTGPTLLRGLCFLYLSVNRGGEPSGFAVKKTIRWIVFRQRRLAGTEFREKLGRQASDMRGVDEADCRPRSPAPKTGPTLLRGLCFLYLSVNRGVEPSLRNKMFLFKPTGLLYQYITFFHFTSSI